jgi:hypothetical protein
LSDLRVPVIRKLTGVGDSRGVTLPKSWILNAEQEAGRKIVGISMEVNHVITLAPVFDKTETKIQSKLGLEVTQSGDSSN